jgi:hypothetical protein
MEQDRLLQVLSMEYETLRSKMHVKSTARFQFLGLTTAGAAIFATGFGQSFGKPAAWVLLAVSAGVLVFGLGAFWRLGRDEAILSHRLAEVERRINRLVPPPENEPELLRWESDHQSRSFVDRWLLGLRLPQKLRPSRADRAKLGDFPAEAVPSTPSVNSPRVPQQSDVREGSQSAD